MSKTVLIQNGRVIDPSQKLDEVTDILLADGRVASIGKAASADETIDAAGMIVAPGLIDVHVHLREPGGEDAETIQSGTAAAVAGGFTGVACMPNTKPALDNDSQIEFVLRQAERDGSCHVYPVGALTKGREGKELAEIGMMMKAGAVAFSDDGTGVNNAGVAYRAMSYVSMFDKIYVEHCEECTLSGGCMNAGPVATKLGLPGIPNVAEDVIVERDITLAQAAGAKLHIQHISTVGAVERVRAAKARGQKVSAEVCPHHLLLTDEACTGYDPNFKMNPPLRTQADVDACLEAVRDGTIDCLVTDHAPHALQTKQLEFQIAPFGIIGLETAVALFAKALVEPGIIDWPQMIAMMSTQPAKLFELPGGTLRVGSPGDITIIDPQLEWTIDASAMMSKSRNTPFDGWKVRGRAVRTIVCGHTQYAL